MPGRVYRNEATDATHLAVFHQLECLVVDRGHHLRPPGRHHRGVHHAFFGRGLRHPAAARLLPVHRAVGRVRRAAPRRHLAGARRLRHGPPQRAAPTAASTPSAGPGFAFGFGLDRLAPARHGVTDLREVMSHRRPLPEPVLMKIAASRWLAGVRALPRRRRPDRRHLRRPRHPGRGGRRASARSSTASWSAGSLALREHPDADKIQLVDVDAGDGEPLQICCGAFNMAVGDLVPLATVGTTMPGGMEIGRRKLRGQWSNGMLCSQPRAGPGRRPRRHPRPRRRRRPGHAAGRRARRRARRALGPRGQPQPARRHVGRRARPRPGRRASTCPSRCPSPEVTPTGAAGRRGGHGRDRRPRPVRPLRRLGAPRRRRSARRPDWMQRRLLAPGHAADQRAGRHLELRDARARPAEPPLRPRPGAGRRPACPPGPRRRDAGHPRRRRADASPPTTC